uniref:C2 domain-containing protein n=1 Tax=Percolomonas cosmopolitus TaxID=63605 RepID=A0A7S1KQX3_9EUKA|mmetsp:Transcript_5055/g.18951  ORF Transcript_5055/g.18951 Transcript_5055/m.18951 type:complete len:397 (+) Transcript_5055:162-1352(+)|eukprot:CAMPEP_0117446668 /NCGR_PEP_ID=MMETSP0759-20121206/6468_1 /TAXON_ID=63605 /ORGANISM="Percolomonas cosmopolitus, Strain WS" /LENGTH=396 /DNA_ID=CAMNT_0005238959 /DNA_START=138 /DNA_END=1328 /DNA_ORIENTATION=+
MHRAKPTASKLCEKRNKDRAYEIHMKKLRNMKSSLNTKGPKKMPHLKRNLKKLQMEQENFEKIKYENQLLLNKMTDIMEKKYIDNENESSKYVHSLNRESRKRELMKITKENQAILKRIQRKQPVYNHMDWERDRQKNEQYIQNICEYPYAGQRTSMGGRQSLRMSQYGQMPGDHHMQSYEQQMMQEQAQQQQMAQYQEQHEQDMLLEDQNVDDLIDEVDKQLEQAGLKDDEDGADTHDESFEQYDEEDNNAAAQDDDQAATQEEDMTGNTDPAPTTSAGEKRVRLTVISASHLKEDASAFVKVQLAPLEGGEPYEAFKPLETQAQTNTSHPEWNEKFSLQCNMDADAFVFSIYDNTSNELIDTVSQKLSELRFRDVVVVTLKSGANLKFLVEEEE